MYISIQRNNKGNLEIDDKVINSQIDYIVSNNINYVESSSVLVGIHKDSNLFILVKFKISDKENFFKNFDLESTTDSIHKLISNSLGLKPKSISFSYNH